MVYTQFLFHNNQHIPTFFDHDAYFLKAAVFPILESGFVERKEKKKQAIEL